MESGSTPSVPIPIAKTVVKPSATPGGRNEYLTAFPPARTPELYALINAQHQHRFAGYFPQRRNQGPYYPPQRYQAPYEQERPIIYRIRQEESNPSVSLALRVTGNGFGSSNNVNPYVNRYTGAQPYGGNRYQGYQDNDFVGYPVAQYEPELRGPYTPAPYR